MARLHVALLGGFRVQPASGEPLVLPLKKAQGLLAFLALRPGQGHSREKLATLFWGDRPEGEARHSLRQALLALRKVLPDGRAAPLLVQGETISLNAAAVDVDAAVFEGLAAEGTSRSLERAASLYRGDLLEGFVLDEEPFEDWLRVERERLRELAIQALGRLLAHQIGVGGVEAAIQTAGRLLALDPIQEEVHRVLMRLYVRQGRRGAACRQYQVCLEGLRRELGVEPEAETTRLYERLLPQRVH